MHLVKWFSVRVFKQFNEGEKVFPSTRATELSFFIWKKYEPHLLPETQNELEMKHKPKHKS